MPKKIHAVFLILLLIGSFVLHTGVHSAGCSAHAGFLPACGKVFPGAQRASFRAQAHWEQAPAELFCPVCAGWLNADLTESSARALRHIACPAVRTGRSAEISRLLPGPASPRAPPQN